MKITKIDLNKPLFICEAIKVGNGHYLLHSYDDCDGPDYEEQVTMRYRNKILKIRSKGDCICIHNHNNIVNKFVDGVIDLLTRQLEPYSEFIKKNKEHDKGKISNKELNEWKKNNFDDINDDMPGNNPWNEKNGNAQKFLNDRFDLIDEDDNNTISFYFDVDTAYISVNNENIDITEGGMGDDYGVPGIFRMVALLECFKDLKEYIEKKK